MRTLVQHVVGANLMSVRLLDGEPADQAVQAMVGEEVLGADPVAAFVDSSISCVRLPRGWLQRCP